MASVWLNLITETAEHYYRHFPTTSTKDAYAAIGMRMYGEYPAIGLPGNNPWVSHIIFLSFDFDFTFLLWIHCISDPIGAKQHEVS